MRAQGAGSIVNVNSGTAFMTIPEYSVYSSSKRAPVGFSLTARAELAKDGIAVSEVYPSGWGNRRAKAHRLTTREVTHQNLWPNRF